MKKLILFLFLIPTLSFSQLGTFSVALTTTEGGAVKIVTVNPSLLK